VTSDYTAVIDHLQRLGLFRPVITAGKANG
jgi:hypothetical protein